MCRRTFSTQAGMKTAAQRAGPLRQAGDGAAGDGEAFSLDRNKAEPRPQGAVNPTGLSAPAPTVPEFYPLDSLGLATVFAERPSALQSQT
jgi:hypothetical protein